MSTVFYHIGLPRAASTFLQQKYFPSLTDAQFLDTSFNNLVNSILYRQSDEALATFTERIRRWKEAEKIILSAESFSMEPWTQQYPQGQFKLFAEVPGEIIVILRDPVDWVLSLHGLASQKGRHVSIEDFVGWNRATRDFKKRKVLDRKTYCNVLALDFFALLEPWIEAFGRNNIHIFHFEDFKNAQAEFFCQLEGLLGPLRSPPDSARINVSASSGRRNTATSAFRLIQRLDCIGFRKHPGTVLGKMLADKIIQGRISVPAMPDSKNLPIIRQALRDRFRPWLLKASNEFGITFPYEWI